MPYGDHATILSGFITDTNGNTICDITDVETFYDEEIVREPERICIDLSNINKPFSMTFQLNPRTYAKTFSFLMGWKAKGPYRGRLLRKLIAWRYVK